jgi:hypothetical protein
MDGVYYVIKHKDGTTWSPPGTSAAPHLFRSEGKANARLKSLSRYYAESKVVPVQLTELKQGVLA